MTGPDRPRRLRAQAAICRACPQEITLAEPKRARDRLENGCSSFFSGWACSASSTSARPGRTPWTRWDRAFELTQQGKAALGLFLLAATWWVFEVVPIGVTSITIGVVQALFLIRPDRLMADGEVISGTWIAFTDFLAPSVWFIFGSIMFGMVFSKTGLTKRMAYKMLGLVGEKTSMIHLGCFVMTAVLTHIMAHTAVAATMYPLLMAIYALYAGDDEKPTKFGKDLFIGMAYVAGAGSIITLLGRGARRGGHRVLQGDRRAARSASSSSPTTCSRSAGSWSSCSGCFMMVVLKPERKTIPGLRERAKTLYARLGPISGTEKLALVIIVSPPSSS